MRKKVKPEYEREFLRLEGGKRRGRITIEGVGAFDVETYNVFSDLEGVGAALIAELVRADANPEQQAADLEKNCYGNLEGFFKKRYLKYLRTGVEPSGAGDE